MNLSHAWFLNYRLYGNRFIVLSSHDGFGRAVTGEPDITVDGMKKHTTFSGVGAELVEMFWAVVEEFSIAQRSLLLKFATGRCVAI